jgi:hypothetical protein
MRSSTVWMKGCSRFSCISTYIDMAERPVSNMHEALNRKGTERARYGKRPSPGSSDAIPSEMT